MIFSQLSLIYRVFNAVLAMLICFGLLTICVDCEAVLAQPADSERQAYLVEVPLPLVGSRGETVRRQISQIAQAAAKAKERPIVVLAFRATVSTRANASAESAFGLQTRGSEFGSCSELARTLTSAEASRVRLVAYLPNSVEGHAVLPVLACEEIVSTASAELGSAAVDDTNVGEGVIGFYREIVNRRRTLPVAVVMSMLRGDVEVYKVKTAQE